MPPLSVSLGMAEYPSMEEIEQKSRTVASQCHFLACRELGIQAGAAQAAIPCCWPLSVPSGLLPFGIDALKTAIEKYLPAKLQASNLKALELGQAALHM